MIVKYLKQVLFFGMGIFVFSCVDAVDPDSTSTLTQEEIIASSYMVEGDLVVTNYSGDSAILLDADGNFKELIYNVQNNQEQVVGVGWNAQTNEVILTINGFPDRIMGVAASDGTIRTIVQNNQFSGNTFGVTINSNGEFLAIESHQIEKFDSAGNRINNGTFPTGTLFNNLAQVNSLNGGGFVVCGYGGDQVATYNSSAIQQNSTASGIGGTTNGYGCDSFPDGRIVASWEGSTDTVRIYNSTLSSTLASYSDTTQLSSPRGIEVKANGNILVTDVGYHYLVELSYDSGAGSLSFVRNIGGGLLNYPWQVLEVPNYN